MKSAALSPRAGKEAIHAAHLGQRSIGRYRFFGTLEALQADDRLWVRDGANSVEVDMNGVRVCLLPEEKAPSADGLTGPLRFEALMHRMTMPEIIPWKHMTSLTEGTNVFVCGDLVSDNGVPLFRGNGREAPVVIMFDGSPRQLLTRAIWFGRHRNEYWNFLTPLSLIAGMLVLLIFAVQAFSSPDGYGIGVLTLSLGAIPVYPLMPPGVIGYFVYRRLWLLGRARRAWRDLLQLPLMYHQGTRPPLMGREKTSLLEYAARLPDGESYVPVVVDYESLREYLDRGATLLRGWQTGKRFVVFGTPRDGKLSRPSDPMAEFVILPEDPIGESRKSAVLAYLWEITSVTILLVSMFANLAVLLRLLPLAL